MWADERPHTAKQVAAATCGELEAGLIAGRAMHIAAAVAYALA